MSKLYRWAEKWIPTIWASMIVFIVTGWCIGASIWVIKWILSLLGVC